MTKSGLIIIYSLCARSTAFIWETASEFPVDATIKLLPIDVVESILIH